jgi:hypothetical protein
LVLSDYISRQQIEQLEGDEAGETVTPGGGSGPKTDPVRIVEKEGIFDKIVDVDDDTESQSIELIKKTLTKLLGKSVL